MSKHTQTQAQPQGQEFFSLNAKYLVAPGADARNLAMDAGCLLEGIEAIMQALIGGLSDPSSQIAENPKDAVGLLFSALYQVKMVSNIVDAMEVTA